ncbi:MAG: hypothetical protein KDC10_03800 [Calditrichaeota bacterium]|nr:hypothetical protein [Calditrichota bacterium]
MKGKVRLLLTSGLACLAACALFEPRGSQEPDSAALGDYLPPASPENVLHNLQEAIRYLEVVPYRELLADSGWISPFRLVPDAEEYLALQGLDWGLDEEDGWFHSLANHFSTLPLDVRHELELDPEARVEQFGDSALFVSSYALEMQHGVESLPERFSGTLSLLLGREQQSGDWAIVRWTDQAADTGAGWTQLRVTFRGP